MTSLQSFQYFKYPVSEVQVLSTSYGVWLWDPKDRLLSYSPFHLTKCKKYNIAQLSKRSNTKTGATRRAAKYVAKYHQYSSIWMEEISELERHFNEAP